MKKEKPKNELVFILNQEMMTTSLIVAKRFDREHKDILRAIKNMECSEERKKVCFHYTDYLDERGRKQPIYNITRDGCMVLIMGLTGPKAMAWKFDFLDAFNEMEAILFNRATEPAGIDRLELQAREQLRKTCDTLKKHPSSPEVARRANNYLLGLAYLNGEDVGVHVDGVETVDRNGVVSFAGQ